MSWAQITEPCKLLRLQPSPKPGMKYATRFHQHALRNTAQYHTLICSVSKSGTRCTTGGTRLSICPSRQLPENTRKRSSERLNPAKFMSDPYLESQVLRPHHGRVDQIKAERVGAIRVHHFGGIGIILFSFAHFLPVPNHGQS